MQCVYTEGHNSDILEIIKGVPQGSSLALILFYIFINDLGKEILTKLHLYADDTIVYASAPSAAQAIEELQTAFQWLQRALKALKLFLNTQKTKFMILSKAQLQYFDSLEIFTANGTLIERGSSF